MFSWDESSFTIKSLPINGLNFLGVYQVKYKIYLQEFPYIALDDKKSFMDVHVLDPCVVLDAKRRPVICFSKNYIKDSMPQWMVDLEH